MTRIVIIGAGSLEFSSRLTADLLTYEDLRNAHFALVDLDEERLEYAGRIVTRIFQEGGYGNASFSLHMERRDALSGANYVISSILVGGYEAIQSEIDIPLKYGVSQAIGDTLTPGGIMRCLRTLPHQVGIARDMAELCPDAILLNYTNPMAMLCWGMYEAVPQIQVVGLCHSVQHTTAQWAHRLSVNIDDVEFDCAGINHQAWITRFECKGEDLLPRIRELSQVQKIWKKDTSRMEYVKHLGFPVTEASGHNSEYSPWFRKNTAMIERYCPGGGWNGAHGFIKLLYNRPDWRITMEKMANWESPVSLERSHEYGAQIINAIASNDPTLIHGNVRNDALIDNLPPGCCVEVPCVIDGKGVHPQKVGVLPRHLAAINRMQISVQELAVSASMESEPELVFQAMAMDPLTSTICTLDDIRDMTNELLVAHQQWLPEPLKGKSLELKPRLYL
jgi:alpha-galactosidase